MRAAKAAPLLDFLLSSVVGLSLLEEEEGGRSTPSVWRYVRAMACGGVKCVAKEIERRIMDSVCRSVERAAW